MVFNTRKVFNPASSNCNYRVFLQVVSFARDVCDYFLAVCKPDVSHFSKSGVWLFRCFGCNFYTYAAFLRAGEINRAVFKRIEYCLEGRGFAFFNLFFSSFSDQLIDCRHDLAINGFECVAHGTLSLLLRSWEFILEVFLLQVFLGLVFILDANSFSEYGSCRYQLANDYVLF